MENNDLRKAIERLEKEIQYLHTDYKRIICQHETINEIESIILKIKQAEETLRFKKKILHYSIT